MVLRRLGVGQPFQRMAPDSAVALGNIRPLDVRSGPQKNSRRPCIGSLDEHNFVAFGKHSSRWSGLARTVHAVRLPRLAIEEIESRENFIQFILTSPAQITLHAIATASAKSPNGRETIRTEGMKMKARISHAAAAV
jgi:hypothetical protein